MTVEEIKALMSKELEEGEEDNRLESVYAELSDRDNKLTESSTKIADLEGKIADLTNKVSDLVKTNAKLAETVKYVEPEVQEEDKEPEVEIADFSKMYETEE